MTLSPLHQLVFRPYFPPVPSPHTYTTHITRSTSSHVAIPRLFILPSSHTCTGTPHPATKEDASNQNHLSTKAQVSSYPPPSLSPSSPSLSILCRYFFLTTSFYFKSCKGKEVDARVVVCMSTIVNASQRGSNEVNESYMQPVSEMIINKGSNEVREGGGGESLCTMSL